MTDRHAALDGTADKLRAATLRQQFRMLHLHSAIRAVPGCLNCRFNYSSIAAHIDMLMRTGRLSELSPVADARFVSSYLCAVEAERDALQVTCNVSLNSFPADTSIVSLYRLVLLGACQLDR